MKKILLSINEFEIRWSDIDAYKHLNNTKYYDFMSEARAKELKKIKNFSTGLVVVENSCKYKAQVYYPDTLIIEQFYQNISEASTEFVYLFKSKNTGKFVAEGFVKIVFFDLIKNKIVRIPLEFKEHLLNTHKLF